MISAISPTPPPLLVPISETHVAKQAQNEVNEKSITSLHCNAQLASIVEVVILHRLCNAQSTVPASRQLRRSKMSNRQIPR